MMSGRSRTLVCCSRLCSLTCSELRATVDLGARAGAANPGRKVMTVLSAMVPGADCVDDYDALRSGQTRVVLGHGVAAPSTLGTFLRGFTFGHVRQLDRVLAQSLCRAWAAGAGPSDEA